MLLGKTLSGGRLLFSPSQLLLSTSNVCKGSSSSHFIHLYFFLYFTIKSVCTIFSFLTWFPCTLFKYVPFLSLTGGKQYIAWLWGSKSKQQAHSTCRWHLGNAAMVWMEPGRDGLARAPRPAAIQSPEVCWQRSRAHTEVWGVLVLSGGQVLDQRRDGQLVLAW